MKPSMPIKCIAPWAGGKRRLAKRIVELLGDHTHYAEVFVGGCSILPAKPRCEIEVVNDANADLVNVLRCVQDKSDDVSLLLTIVDFSREGFESALAMLKSHTTGYHTPMHKAAMQLAVWWMGANGFAGTTKDGWFAQRHTETGGDPAVRWANFKASLPALSERLRNVEVTNAGYCKFLDMIDDKSGTAIYCDPPYLEKSLTYTHDFDGFDHAILAARLNEYQKARVVVSYYDHPALVGLYPSNRWRRVYVGVSKSSASASGKAKRAVELILVNDAATHGGGT